MRVSMAWLSGRAGEAGNRNCLNLQTPRAIYSFCISFKFCLLGKSLRTLPPSVLPLCQSLLPGRLWTLFTSVYSWVPTLNPVLCWAQTTQPISLCHLHLLALPETSRANVATWSEVVSKVILTLRIACLHFPLKSSPLRPLLALTSFTPAAPDSFLTLFFYLLLYVFNHFLSFGPFSLPEASANPFYLEKTLKPNKHPYLIFFAYYPSSFLSQSH